MSLVPAIQIFALRSWGELGNFKAAQDLKQSLNIADPELTTAILCGEDFVEITRFYGEQLNQLSKRKIAASKKMVEYKGILDLVEREFPANFEVGAVASDHAAKLSALAAWFRASRPLLIICMKGFMARLAVAALRVSGLRIPVANFVTNHGLQLLTIHQARLVDFTFVPLERTRDLLIELGVGRDRIMCVGPLSSISLGATLPREQSPDRPIVVILCNRGGEAYLSLLQRLIDHGTLHDILFISVNSVDIYSRAIAIASRNSRVQVTQTLPKEDFAERLMISASHPNSFLISKTGPNTMFEAARFGLPMLVHRTWLPMEEWVGSFIEGHNIGTCVADETKLEAPALCWLKDLNRVPALKPYLACFKSKYLNANFNSSIALACRRLLGDG